MWEGGVEATKEQVAAVSAFVNYKWKQFGIALIISLVIFGGIMVLGSHYILFSLATLSDDDLASYSNSGWSPVAYFTIKGFGFMTLIIFSVAMPISYLLSRRANRKCMARFSTLPPDVQRLYINWIEHEG